MNQLQFGENMHESTSRPAQSASLAIPLGADSLAPQVTVSMQSQSHDPVNHPSHYTSSATGVECLDITEHMDFLTGNALKYVWRCGLKTHTSELQDLEKAAFYLRHAIRKAYGVRREKLQCDALSKYLERETDRQRRGFVVLITSNNPYMWEHALLQVESRIKELQAPRRVNYDECRGPVRCGGGNRCDRHQDIP